MTPADQEFIHDPQNGQYGDCQRAVIASLLDLPITAVPHFLQEAAGEPVAYWEKLQTFVRSHGFVYLNVPARAGLAFYGDEGDVFHEISGPSPRGNGVGHAVVGCNGQIVFDPHPSRAGLAGDPATWEHAYLVRINAVRPRELELLQFEIAAHEVAENHLSRMVDELRELVQDAKQAMTALHQAAIPDESRDGVPAIISPDAFRRFVDAHAQLCFCLHQLGHDGPREQPQRYEITSVKYLAGELTMRAVDDAEVPQALESGQVVTLK